MDPHDGEVMETHTADDDDPDSAFTPQPEAGSTGLHLVYCSYANPERKLS